ncbi:hypothetical protein [Nocardia sp. NPDC052112]|uniref:hypothetical protein n=1 Tax=Nocardia sp. NPDC052112 TaxID=3155646 RepID=UPI003424211C
MTGPVAAAIILIAAVTGCSKATSNDEVNPVGNQPAPAVRTLDCQAVAELIGDHLTGLRVWPKENDPDLPEGTVGCAWEEEGGPRSLQVRMEPEPTSPDEVERIRAGKVYTGQYPPYEIIDTERLRAADAIGALAVDADSGDTTEEIASIRQIIVHTPHTTITVTGWKAAQIIEISTRVAEKLKQLLG